MKHASEDEVRNGASDAALVEDLARTKTVLLIVVAAVAGVVILIAGDWISSWQGRDKAWVKRIPMRPIGTTLFSTAVVLFAFEYVARNETEKRAAARLSRVLPSQMPLIQRSVFDALSSDPNSIQQLLNEPTMDLVTTNILSARLGDQRLAREAYSDLLTQVISAPERWADLDLAISVRNAAVGPPAGPGSMFDVVLTLHYRGGPTRPTLSFVCTTDIDDYRSRLRDPSVHSVWYFEPTQQFGSPSPEVFDVLSVTVDGEEIPRARADGPQTATVTAALPPELLSTDEEHDFAATYRVLVQRNSHVIHYDVAQPCREVRLRFDYSSVPIRYVNVLDYFAGAHSAGISRIDRETLRYIEVSYRGWALPKSGAGFVWVLEEEMHERPAS